MCYKQGQSEIDKNSYIYYENSNEHTKREMITVIDNTSVFSEIEFKDEAFVEPIDFEGIQKNTNPIKPVDLNMSSFATEIADYIEFIKDKMTKSVTIDKESLKNIVERLKDKKNKFYKNLCKWYK